jgi:hypothetical protein
MTTLNDLLAQADQIRVDESYQAHEVTPVSSTDPGTPKYNHHFEEKDFPFEVDSSSNQSWEDGTTESDTQEQGHYITP